MLVCLQTGIDYQLTIGKNNEQTERGGPQKLKTERFCSLSFLCHFGVILATARDSFPDYRSRLYNPHATPFAPQTSAAGTGAEDPAGTGAEDSAGSEARPVWTLCGLVSLFSCNRNGVDSGKMDSAWI